MDQAKVSEWSEYCEGKQTFGRQHFADLFHDLLSEPLSDQDKTDLNTIFGYFLDSSRILAMFLRFHSRAPDPT